MTPHHVVVQQTGMGQLKADDTGREMGCRGVTQGAGDRFPRCIRLGAEQESQVLSWVVCHFAYEAWSFWGVQGVLDRAIKPPD